jgi:hypothetical protein
MKVIAAVITGLLLCAKIVSAQSTVKGKVMELQTDVMLSGITVENQITHIKTQTDPFGNFSISAKKGDLLSFSGLNYVPDTIYLTNTKNRTVFLILRSNQLKEVQVKQHEINTTGWSFPPEKGVLGSKTVYYKPSGGLKVKLFGPNVNNKKRKKLEQLELDGEREREIAKVFNASNLKNYVPLSGQELVNFIIKYTPSVNTYYNDKFNFADYINKSYKAFLTLPEDKRKSAAYLRIDVESN